MQHCSNLVLSELYELSWQARKTHHRGRLFVQGRRYACTERSDWPESCLIFSELPMPGVHLLNEYRQHLGSENQYVVVDCHSTVHADAIAALAGTLVRGGVLVLLVPEKMPPFLQRLVNTGPPALSRYIATGMLERSKVSPPPPPEHTGKITLTEEQSDVLRAMTSHLEHHQPALLTAPRGRGKSTVFGFLAAYATNKVWVCAPSRRQVFTLLQHAKKNGTEVQFIAPDALLNTNAVAREHTLLVDEAASLPRHILDAIIEKFPQVKMATTTEGYEGCGRGFVLQFVAELKTRFSLFCHFELVEPQRWAREDPLEQWLQNALLLPGADQLEPPHMVGDQRYEITHAHKLSESSLRLCFQLLLDAHYQTSPNDLKLLLDDPGQVLLLQWKGPQLSGIVWLSHEGKMDSSLTQAIFEGKRRPPGNLLTQSATYYLRDKDAARDSLLRIVRIAVSPALQNRGLGQALIKQCIAYAKENHAAALGTSFGLAEDLLRFWQRAQFSLVRIGIRPDTVSGRYAGLFFLPLNEAWQEKVKVWHRHLLAQLNWQLLRTPLPSRLVRTLLPLNKKIDLSLSDGHVQAMLKAFADGTIDFDLAQPVLSTWLVGRYSLSPVLETALTSSSSLSEIAAQQGFSGRKDYVKCLREICFDFCGPL